jgi:hypothetical protein
MVTLAPNKANCFAMANPMPLVLPHTKAFLPVKSIFMKRKYGTKEII